jgi:selenocysteine lyase/cysteine desulfurase
VLAASLPAGTRVLSSRVEHHAHMLPWRRHGVRLLPFTRSAGELLEAAERALAADRIDLVAVTGASNVTGEVWPVAELAALAHRDGAAVFVDAAQLAPHRRIDMARAGSMCWRSRGISCMRRSGRARWWGGWARASRWWPVAARSGW